ncbi:TPA: hypothetical protein U2J78_005023 [Serratia marcescens]|nr:hypothetical protein [Serratia marcescens]
MKSDDTFSPKNIFSRELAGAISKITRENSDARDSINKFNSLVGDLYDNIRELFSDVVGVDIDVGVTEISYPLPYGEPISAAQTSLSLSVIYPDNKTPLILKFTPDTLLGTVYKFPVKVSIEGNPNLTSRLENINIILARRKSFGSAYDTIDSLHCRDEMDNWTFFVDDKLKEITFVSSSASVSDDKDTRKKFIKDLDRQAFNVDSLFKLARWALITHSH